MERFLVESFKIIFLFDKKCCIFDTMSMFLSGYNSRVHRSTQFVRFSIFSGSITDEMLIRTMKRTLKHNVSHIYLVLIFNI